MRHGPSPERLSLSAHRAHRSLEAFARNYHVSGAIHSWSTGSRLFRRCAVAMDDLRRIEESRVARIIFDGGEEEGLLVTPLGANLYRLEETPIPLYRDFETADADLQLWRGDTIEAEVLESGALRYRTTAAKTPWR